MKNKLVFTDVDGYEVFENQRGDLVDRRGQLLDLEAEANIRIEMGQWQRTGLEYGE